MRGLVSKNPILVCNPWTGEFEKKYQSSRLRPCQKQFDLEEEERYKQECQEFVTWVETHLGGQVITLPGE